MPDLQPCVSDFSVCFCGSGQPTAVAYQVLLCPPRVIMRDALRAGCSVRYMARHVVGHTMQSFHTWRILDGQCPPECEHLVGIMV